MSEIVERVARAICEARKGYGCGAKLFVPYQCGAEEGAVDCGCGFWDGHKKAARAAITAMRVPNDEMVLAGQDIDAALRNA